VTTASNRVFWSTAVHRSVGHRPWIAILAAAGWLLLTTLAVLLAARAWSAPGPPPDNPTVSPEPNADKATALPTLPQKATGLPVLPQAASGSPALPRRIPRAPSETVIDLRSAAALIPRQATDRAS
jgi:hypothetical protein